METPVPKALPDIGAQTSSGHVLRRSRRSRVSTAVFVVACLGVFAGGIAFRMNDLHVQTVLSGSMRPTAQPGDLAITEGVPTTSLHVGDVIVFMPPNATVPVLHRIASREGNVVTTKGDANSVADPWRITLAGAIGYRLVFVVPFAGYLAQLRGVALIASGLIVALLILREIRKGVGARRTQVAS